MISITLWHGIFVPGLGHVVLHILQGASDLENFTWRGGNILYSEEGQLDLRVGLWCFCTNVVCSSLPTSFPSLESVDLGLGTLDVGSRWIS